MALCAGFLPGGPAWKVAGRRTDTSSRSNTSLYIGAVVKTLHHFLIPAVLVVATSGCIPGQHLTDRKLANSELVTGGQVEIVEINSDLVSKPVVVDQMPAELLNYKAGDYRLAPGDTLLITVWDHPELTTPAGTQQQALTNGRPVQSDGSLYFPYVGRIQAAGMSVPELRDHLRKKLAGYVVDPQVDVNVTGYGSKVSLYGAFNNGAAQEIPLVGRTLTQAIGAAGINAATADLSGFVLSRDGRNYRLDLDQMLRKGQVSPDIFLKAGDVLYLPFNDRNEAYVLGEVLRPQSLTFKTTDMSLTQALGRVGGLNPLTSSGENVYVIRGFDSAQKLPATVYHLDARSPVSFVLADRFQVRPGDVVWVGPAGVTRWNRFVTQLLPFTGIINQAANTRYNLDN